MTTHTVPGNRNGRRPTVLDQDKLAAGIAAGHKPKRLAYDLGTTYSIAARAMKRFKAAQPGQQF